jgi:hypothetical protein
VDKEIGNLGVKLMAAGFSGLASTVLAFPVDVLRTRVAASSTVRSAFANGGFTRGLGVALLETVPTSLVTWVLYDILFSHARTLKRSKDDLLT